MLHYSLAYNRTVRTKTCSNRKFIFKPSGLGASIYAHGDLASSIIPPLTSDAVSRRTKLRRGSVPENRQMIQHRDNRASELKELVLALQVSIRNRDGDHGMAGFKRHTFSEIFTVDGFSGPLSNPDGSSFASSEMHDERLRLEVVHIPSVDGKWSREAWWFSACCRGNDRPLPKAPWRKDSR